MSEISDQCSLPGAIGRLRASSSRVAVEADSPLRQQFLTEVQRIKAERKRGQSKADNLSAEEKARRRLAVRHFSYRFADTKNLKFGLNDSVGGKKPADPKDVRSSWSYIHMPKNARLYSTADLAAIKRRIMAAAKDCGVKLNPDKTRDAIRRNASDAEPVSAHSVVVEGKPPEWIELLPLGEFSGRDGRGPFKVSDPERVIQATKALHMEAGIPIDYDHATDFGAPEGRPAPAAGWITQLEVRNGAIWGRVEWTPRAASALEEKEYRYISPVFTFVKAPGAKKDEQCGEVSSLLRAALTNNPNLELTAIAAGQLLIGRRAAMAKKSKIDALVEQIQEAAEETGLPVDTLLEGISHKLGGDLEDPDSGGEASDPDDAPDDAGDNGGDGGDTQGAPGEGDDDEEMVRRRHREAAARRNEDGLEESPAQRMEREDREAREIEAAKTKRDERRAGRLANIERDKRNRGDKDPREDALRDAHSRRGARNRASMVASDPAVVKMAKELRDLQAERAREKAVGAVNAAIRERRLTPAQRDWAINYCLENPDGFRAFVAGAPRLLSDEEFSGAPRGGNGPAAALSREEMKICSAFGLNPAKFAEHKTVMMSQNHRDLSV